MISQAPSHRSSAIRVGNPPRCRGHSASGHVQLQHDRGAGSTGTAAGGGCRGSRSTGRGYVPHRRRRQPLHAEEVAGLVRFVDCNACGLMHEHGNDPEDMNRRRGELGRVRSRWPICSTSRCPSAAAMTSTNAASSSGSTMWPSRSRKTTAASQARRLFPSTRAWLPTKECSVAAALSSSDGYASSPRMRACGRADAASSSPTSETGPACNSPVSRSRSSTSRWSRSHRPEPIEDVTPAVHHPLGAVIDGCPMSGTLVALEHRSTDDALTGQPSLCRKGRPSLPEELEHAPTLALRR